MKISFHGATQTVTGSKHLIILDNGKQILLDCGMFQGMGKETLELNENLGFNPSEVDYMFLSHAHIDHSGLIPKLVKEGFNGRIFGSLGTLDMTDILLKNSAYIQTADAKFINKKRLEQGRPFVEPLYTMEEAIASTKNFESLQYNIPVKIDEDIEVTLYDTGHILGATMIFLSITEHGKTINIAYSGDVGRYGDPILRSPAVFPQADYIIIESTYGNRLHDKIDTTPEKLREIIEETCIGKRGKLIIPAFSVGRTQELLFALNELELDYRLPDVPYYIDSPLSTEATKVVKRHPECFNRAVQKIMRYDKDPFDFKGLHYIEDKRESQALNGSEEPCVIISASGMAEAGRVKHHIANGISNPRNTILMVGYCEKNSLGAKLKEHPDEVTIFGERFQVKAEIQSIESMSAHADYNDLCQYLSTQEPKEVRQVFIVHGEPESQIAFKDRLHNKGFMDIIIPKIHETYSLG
jgi:metallo-beta-lactamase family protein